MARQDTQQKREEENKSITAILLLCPFFFLLLFCLLALHVDIQTAAGNFPVWYINQTLFKFL